MISRELSEKIKDELTKVSIVFSDFQKKSGLTCPAGCGQCCFNPEVSCTPNELLPLAFHLLENNKAEEYLVNIQTAQKLICPLLFINDEEKGLGKCLEYEFRPFVCRAFGVSARHNKVGKPDLVVCKVLKSKNEYPELKNLMHEMPYIDEWRKNFQSLDPSMMDQEIPISAALAVVLEKVLLWDSYQRH